MEAWGDMEELLQAKAAIKQSSESKSVATKASDRDSDAPPVLLRSRKFIPVDFTGEVADTDDNPDIAQC